MKKYPQLIDPVEGRIYMNNNSSAYRCTRRINSETAVMVRETDGWTLIAHQVRRLENGSIEWDYSTSGHWPGGIPRTVHDSVFIQREDKHGD
ncbi:hypothetical protein [uncultured Oscillibacter sp.]|uniref:hypothetical protein n=1 Tax=uncultured Oscillibacter sp. TaxID=876091 RepID=UPI00266F169B|nr:hypothetical protein [uncultured Oscillibacter sp.]